MDSLIQGQKSKQSNRCNLVKLFQSFLVSQRFQKYFKMLFLTIYCIIELIDLFIKIFKIQQFSELQNDIIIFLVIAIISIIMIILISFSIIHSNLEQMLICCLLGCLFESFLFNKQKILRLCAFFIFSQRTVKDMQRLQGNKVAFFILVLYPAVRCSIENIYNISLLIQNLLLLFANYLFSVVKNSNNNKMQQKNSIAIQQNSQKNNNYSQNNQTDQSNFIQNKYDDYRISSQPLNINLTKHDQSCVNQIYNKMNNNNFSILNEDDLLKFNSFQESKIKQTQLFKNESNLIQEREFNIKDENIQNLTYKDTQIKFNNHVQKEPQKNQITDLIMNQISVGIILLDSDKKLVYNNKVFKKIINKRKIFGNVTKLTYFLSLKLQNIKKIKKQYEQTEYSTNQSARQITKISINQQLQQQNIMFDQFFKDQKQKRDKENNQFPKNIQKQNINNSAINQYQTRKNIQQNNSQNFLSEKKQEYRKTNTVEVFSNELEYDALFKSNKLKNSQQNINTKISESTHLFQQTNNLTNQQNSKEFLNKQDKTSNQSFINSKIRQSQLQFQKVVQCILPNNINILFIKENLQIDDIIDFLIKYSTPPQYKKMNTDTQVSQYQKEEIFYQFSNKQQKYFDNNQKTKQEEEEYIFDGKSNYNTEYEKKKVKKKLYDYFIQNNQLHVTVQQKGNDLSQQEIKYFGIKLSVLYLQDFVNHKFILIETSDLTILKKQIDNESSDIFKNKILSSVSHELRTPLNCSIQMLDMLSQNDEISYIMKQIFIYPALNSNLLLLNIINDILDLAQINNGKFTMTFSQFELNQICTECINLISIQALQKNIVIQLDLDSNMPQFIHSDSVRIRQVLLNLLSNALKFTQVGKITLRTKLIDETLIQIEIEDTGCGISEKNVNKLNRRFNEKDIFNFEYFQNCQINTIDIGLGLTVTNNLATGLGGNRKLYVQSVESVGTKFSFWIVNHSTKKLGCKFTRKIVFNKEIIKWKSILNSQQQQKYFQGLNDSFKQNSNQNSTNVNMGRQSQNLSIRSRMINEDSSNYLQNSKYQQSVQQLVKFNNEISQCQGIYSQSINDQKDYIYNPQKKESLSNSTHNMSPIESKKINKFQLSFNDLSLLKEDHIPNLETNSLIDQISMKKQNKEYFLKSYEIQINEANSQESFHSSESNQQQMINSQNLSKQSQQQVDKLINNNPDSISNSILQMQQERKNDLHNFENLQLKNDFTPAELQNKTTAEFTHNLIQTQLSLLSNLSQHNQNITFNKSNSLASIIPSAYQFTSEKMNLQIQNKLKHQIYTMQQKQIQKLIDEQNEEQYNIINQDNYEIIQTPNQFFGQKVSKKRINNHQTFNSSNIIVLQDIQTSNNDIGVKSKFKNQNLNQMNSKQVMQNQFFQKGIQSNTQELKGNSIEYQSGRDQILEDTRKNDQIEMIENKLNKTHITQYEPNKILKQTKQLQSFISQDDYNHQQYNLALKTQNPEPFNQNKQIITDQNLKKIEIIENHISNQFEKPKLLNPQQNSKWKIQSFTSQKKCQCANILIVDDNDFNIYALETRLKSYGFITDKATSGIIAIEKVKNKFEKEQNCCNLYTLIFMDISMPVKDGYETTQDILSYLRDKKVAQPPPISACTAYIQQTEQDRVKMCGMQYYITKPINKQILEEVLISVIFDIKN